MKPCNIRKLGESDKSETVETNSRNFSVKGRCLSLGMKSNHE